MLLSPQDRTHLIADRGQVLVALSDFLLPGFLEDLCDFIVCEQGVLLVQSRMRKRLEIVLIAGTLPTFPCWMMLGRAFVYIQDWQRTDSTVFETGHPRKVS